LISEGEEERWRERYEWKEGNENEEQKVRSKEERRKEKGREGGREMSLQNGYLVKEQIREKTKVFLTCHQLQCLDKLAKVKWHRFHHTWC
jgi:hypothetical protein